MPIVVGIGASAGGLSALEQFLAGVPEASGLAYIVIQHLDPTHPALLCELLQRVTSMRVCEARQSMRLEPDSVYVIPPNSELTVEDHVIQVTRPMQRRGMRLPIDALFQSLARVHADRAIGVVLSGMGADGTQGLLAIKRQHGLTLAQTPSSAQFDSMPASAIAAGCVDIVAEPQLLPEWICRSLAQGVSIGSRLLPGAPAAGPPPSRCRRSLPCSGTATSAICRGTRPARCCGAWSGAWRCADSARCGPMRTSCATTPPNWI